MYDSYSVGDLVCYTLDMGLDVEAGPDKEMYPKFPIYGEVTYIRDEDELHEGEDIEYLVKFVDHLGDLPDVEEWYTKHEIRLIAKVGSW